MHSKNEILGHYYDHIVKSGRYPYHPCNVVSKHCQKIGSLCCTERCKTPFSCFESDLHEKVCNAMTKDTFDKFANFFLHKNIVPKDLCHKGRFFFVDEYIREEWISVKSSDKIIDWTMEKVIIICVFTDAYKTNSSLLNDLLMLLKNPKKRDFDNKNIQDFIVEYRENDSAIPCVCDIGQMLTQSIILIEDYAPQINIIDKNNITHFVIEWLKNQINIKYDDINSYT